MVNLMEDLVSLKERMGMEDHSCPTLPQLLLVPKSLVVSNVRRCLVHRMGWKSILEDHTMGNVLLPVISVTRHLGMKSHFHNIGGEITFFF